jgi:hypothetical protein
VANQGETVQDLHLTPEAIAVGITAEEADKLGLIRTRAILATNGGPKLSKEDLAFALSIYDRLEEVCDFEEERRWQAECIRKDVQS